FLPNLHSEQRLLACSRERAGLRHGKADLDGLARREGGRSGQRGCDQSGADAGVNAAACDAMGHGFPPEGEFFALSTSVAISRPGRTPTSDDAEVSELRCLALAPMKREHEGARGNLPGLSAPGLPARLNGTICPASHRTAAA